MAAPLKTFVGIILAIFLSASGCYLGKLTGTALLAHGSTNGAAAGALASADPSPCYAHAKISCTSKRSLSPSSPSPQPSPWRRRA